MNIAIGIVIGLLIYVFVNRPITKIRLRKEFKDKGYPMNKLKWYEWFL